MLLAGSEEVVSVGAPWPRCSFGYLFLLKIFMKVACAKQTSPKTQEFPALGSGMANLNLGGNDEGYSRQVKLVLFVFGRELSCHSSRRSALSPSCCSSVRFGGGGGGGVGVGVGVGRRADDLCMCVRL